MIAEIVIDVKNLIIEVAKNWICLGGMILIAIGCIGAIWEMLQGG